jgi:hypothetical protein
MSLLQLPVGHLAVFKSRGPGYQYLQHKVGQGRLHLSCRSESSNISLVAAATLSETADTTFEHDWNDISEI